MIERSRRGFTLIEMLIVVVIVAILAAIAYGRFSRPSLSALVVPDSVVAPQASGRFVVQVENAFGRPQRGVPVVFRVIDGSATIAPEVVQTDSTGAARAQWTASAAAGLNSFAATVGESDWDRSQVAVTFRVDPLLGSPVAPAPTGGAGAGADSVPPAAGTGAAGSSPPPQRDTTRGAPPPVDDDDAGAAGRSPDTAMTRVPWTSAPLWAHLRLEPVAVGHDD